MSKHELELDEFQALAYGAHSVVGHKDIAKGMNKVHSSIFDEFFKQALIINGLNYES
jgi:uncharacterized protein YggL (DUF469 family)